MGNKKTVWLIAKAEYIKWITDPRVILFPMLLIFLYQIAVEPLSEMAEQMQKPIHWLEPFIAVTNSPLLMLFIPLIFLALLGDFPRTDGNAMFFIYRVGRKSWIQGELLFVLMAISTFLICIAVGVTVPLVGQLQWKANWSETVRLYTRTFPDKAESFAADLIPEQLYNQMSPYMALFNTCFLQVLYLLILSLLLLWFWCAGHRKVGFFVTVCIVAFGAAVAFLKGALMWFFPMAHANIWLRHISVLRRVMFPLWGSYVVLIFCVCVLIALDWRKIQQYNFFDVTEME